MRRGESFRGLERAHKQNKLPAALAAVFGGRSVFGADALAGEAILLKDAHRGLMAFEGRRVNTLRPALRLRPCDQAAQNFARVPLPFEAGNNAIAQGDRAFAVRRAHEPAAANEYTGASLHSVPSPPARLNRAGIKLNGEVLLHIGHVARRPRRGDLGIQETAKSGGVVDRCARDVSAGRDKLKPGRKEDGSYFFFSTSAATCNCTRRSG